MHLSGAQYGRVSVLDIIRLAWPMMIGMLSFTVMDFTDTLVAGQLGKTEVAAVGLATTAMLLINALFLGLFESVKIFVAQAVGANDEEKTRHGAWQGVWIALVAGVIVLGLGQFGPLFFKMSGAPENVVGVAQEYFVIRVFAALPWFVTLAFNNYYQGLGNTRLPMKINIIDCVVNVVLDWVLALGISFNGYVLLEPMGVAGIAWATVIASVVGMCVVIALFISERGFHPNFDKPMLFNMLHTGWPVGIRFLLDIGGWSMFVVLIARMGENELAANQIATKILFLSILPGYGIAETACVFVGQRFGAKDMLGVRSAYRSAIILSCIIMSALGIMFVSIPAQLVGLFQNDTEVLAIGSQLILLVALYQIIDVNGMVSASCLNGAGDTRFVMYTSIFGTWLIMLPCAYLLGIHLGFGAAGVWIGNIINVTLGLIIMSWRFRKTQKIAQ